MEEGQGKAAAVSGWSTDAEAVRRRAVGGIPLGARGRAAWAGWPWPGELGRPGPVGPEDFFQTSKNKRKTK